jgi:predicted dienelactone hydrolase
LLDTWIYNHDAGTTGTAVGTTSLVGTPSLSGNARQFASSYTDNGGEIYSVVYADDTTSMNFVYDGWVWIEAGSSIANLEMDSNQVLANGQTIIYAFQCSGNAGVWEYSGAGAHWVHSSQPCNPANWETNDWHHVQISYSRDDAGNVTYQSVWLDGNEQAINATVPSSFALGWKVGVVQTQFQMDGLATSGSSTVYLDNLTISRW